MTKLLNIFHVIVLHIMRLCERFAWISVDERLPDRAGFYICRMGVEPYMGARIDIVFYATKETMWAKPVLYGWANNTITHWLPLPRLPKK